MVKFNVDVCFNTRIKTITKKSTTYEIIQKNGRVIETPFILNASYGSINQILHYLDYELFDIKYEIAELCICKPSFNIADVGITVMDGPFFSVMPFGLTGYHSLSAVHYTPHATSQEQLPVFNCQNSIEACSATNLANCNTCPARPSTTWASMLQLAKKYLEDDTVLQYEKSLFAVKPILKRSEVDDSRPTVIKVFSEDPTFISVLSGKINTIYDLDEALIR